MKFLISFIIVLFSFSTVNSQTFEACGYVEWGIECTVFLSDDGGLYSLTDFGDYKAGDYVSVKGKVDTTILSFCMQGPWIVVESIGSCVYTFDQCGVMYQGAECLMFKSNDGNLYAVTDSLMDPLEGLNDGDMVHIAGQLIYTFASVCNEETASVIVYSFNKESCPCIGMRGNMDGDENDVIDMIDLTFIVNYFFKGGDAPPSMEEADVNGSGEVNIRDLTYFISYFFKGGDAPVNCP